MRDGFLRREPGRSARLRCKWNPGRPGGNRDGGRTAGFGGRGSWCARRRRRRPGGPGRRARLGGLYRGRCWRRGRLGGRNRRRRSRLGRRRPGWSCRSLHHRSRRRRCWRRREGAGFRSRGDRRRNRGRGCRGRGRRGLEGVRPARDRLGGRRRFLELGGRRPRAHRRFGRRFGRPDIGLLGRRRRAFRRGRPGRLHGVSCDCFWRVGECRHDRCFSHWGPGRRSLWLRFGGPHRLDGRLGRRGLDSRFRRRGLNSCFRLRRLNSRFRLHRLDSCFRLRRLDSCFRLRRLNGRFRRCGLDSLVLGHRFYRRFCLGLSRCLGLRCFPGVIQLFARRGWHGLRPSGRRLLALAVG